MSCKDVQKALRKVATKKRAEASIWFFKTGKGEYGYVDKFIGVSMPDIRMIVRRFNDISVVEVEKLLKSKVHEERMTGILILVDYFQGGDRPGEKEYIARIYLKNLKYVNNWDLVDCSAHKILGPYLEHRDRKLLYKLAKSKVLWERRVAVISTFYYIYHGDSKDMLKLAKLLLKDPEDLMHKAVGWGLREVGKRVDIEDLRKFLKRHHKVMPRTMLRYSIEKLSKAERMKWMGK